MFVKFFRKGNPKLCNKSHPEYSWRKCVSPKGHTYKHYVPPVSFNYEYWGDS